MMTTRRHNPAARAMGLWLAASLFWLWSLARFSRAGASAASLWPALAGLALLAAGARQARLLPGVKPRRLALAAVLFALIGGLLLFSLASVSPPTPGAQGLDAFVQGMKPRRSQAQTKTALWAAGALLAGSLAAMPLYRLCRRRAATARGLDPSGPMDSILSGLLLLFLWAGIFWPRAWIPAAGLFVTLTAWRAKSFGLAWAALLALLQPWNVLDELLHGRVFMLYQLAPGRFYGPSGGETIGLPQQTIERQIEADIAWRQAETDRLRRQRWNSRR